MQPKKVKPGEWVFHQHDKGSSMYIVKSGKLRMLDESGEFTGEQGVRFDFSHDILRCPPRALPFTRWPLVVRSVFLHPLGRFCRSTTPCIGQHEPTSMTLM